MAIIPTASCVNYSCHSRNTSVVFIPFCIQCFSWRIFVVVVVLREFCCCCVKGMFIYAIKGMIFLLSFNYTHIFRTHPLVSFKNHTDMLSMHIYLSKYEKLIKIRKQKLKIIWKILETTYRIIFREYSTKFYAVY